MNAKELLAELRTKLRAAVAEDFAKWTTQFDDVCGYAVCAPPYIESIFPTYQLASESLEDEAAYYPAEWESFGTLTFGPEIRELCTKIHAARVLYDKDEDEGLEADLVFNTIFSVLTEMEAEGVFGDKNSGRYLTMWDVGNDEDWIIKASKKLNSAKLHTKVKLALLGE